MIQRRPRLVPGWLRGGLKRGLGRKEGWLGSISLRLGWIQGAFRVGESGFRVSLGLEQAKSQPKLCQVKVNACHSYIPGPGGELPDSASPLGSRRNLKKTTNFDGGTQMSTSREVPFPKRDVIALVESAGEGAAGSSTPPVPPQTWCPLPGGVGSGQVLQLRLDLVGRRRLKRNNPVGDYGARNNSILIIENNFSSC